MPTKDPLGRELYWFAVRPVEGADEGTDRWAIERGWASMTPLRLDLTDEQQLGAVRTRHPLDETIASAVSPPTTSPETEKTVRDDEAAHTMTKAVDQPAVTEPAID